MKSIFYLIMKNTTKYPVTLITVMAMSVVLTSCGPALTGIIGIYHAKLGQHQKAVNDFTQVISSAPNSPDIASCYFMRGNEYYQLALYQKAIDDYDKGLNLDSSYTKLFGANSGNSKTYGWRGSAYNKLGQYQKAIDNYNKWISLNPKYAAAYQMRANAYKSLGNLEAAKKDEGMAKKLGYKKRNE